jgi:hypothetical protein
MAKRSEVPVGMRKVHGRFERWRKSHVGRQPIPEGLWRAATELANEHGVCRTAEVLHLEYGKLRRLAESAVVSRRGSAAKTRRTSFVELVAPPVPAVMGGLECVIELEGPHGKLRIQWKGATAPDLAGLSRTLWESA